jgi:hypothetical protein
MRDHQCLLRAGDVPSVESDPPEFGERPPELAAQVRTQLLAGQQGLGLGFEARSAEPQDLGAVDTTAPTDASDGVGLAPPFHRLCPLLGDVVLAEALQCAHELAVDDAGRDRIELSGDGRHPGSIEQCETLLHITVQDHEPGLCHLSESAGSGGGHRPDVDGLPGP